MKTLLFSIVLMATGVISLLAQPIITQPPTNQVVAAGGTVALSAAASGTAPLAYQWFKDSRLLVGATSSTLTVANAGVTNSGSYSVVVTNGDGMIISLPALVSVGNPALIAWGCDSNGQLGNGSNTNGQLYNGTTNKSYVPLTVASNVVAGSAGSAHSLFIKNDGTLWAMGYNVFGQLGNGTTKDTNVPVNVASSVVAAAAGYGHSLFVKGDGTLWAMGRNNYGQLGNGTTSDVHSPIKVASNVVAVATGQFHSLFLTSDGTLWTMGYNVEGQLGNGSTANTNLPISVASNVVAIAAGVFHSLFVKSDETLWAMGWNNYGQLGNGTTSNTNLPVNVANNVVAVAAGTQHSLFIKNDLTLWTVGCNISGQLGNGTTTSTNLPVSVASNVVAISGADYSLFVQTDGKLWGMGYNRAGQLGTGNTNNARLPVSVPMSVANVFPAGQALHSLAIGINYRAVVTLTNLVQPYMGGAINATASTIPAGLTVNLTYNGSSSAPTNCGSYTVIGTISDPNYFGVVTNTLVITPMKPADQVLPLGGTINLSAGLVGGTSWAYQWFKDSRLLLGATNSTLTVANAGVTNTGSYSVVVTNTSGMLMSLPALVAVGTPSLLAWGYNAYGELGNGTNGANTSTNQPISVVSNVVASAAGLDHSSFIKSDQTFWTMGQNNYGQLGNGTTVNTNLPINVASNVVVAAAGQLHSLFVKNDGTLWAIGLNTYGQLGNGTTSGTTANPKAISVASNVVAATAGTYHSLFVTVDGTLWAMGRNNYGQLGNGTTNNSSVPTSVASNVVAVAAGTYYSVFVKNDRTLWAMGINNYGQLGNGTTNNTSLPICVASNVVATAAGFYHSLFVKNDATLWAMGRNNYGQLGNGTTNDASLPTSVASNVMTVAAGTYHSLFVENDGTLWAMGLNSFGQLGNGTTINTNQPVNVPNLFMACVFRTGGSDHSLAIGINRQASVTLGNLNQTYTGSAINTTASTLPAGLTVNLTYNGSSLAPTNCGRYTVVGTISDPLYFGSTTNTLIIAPSGPTNQVLALGAALTLRVAAGTDPALKYQWFKDGRLILGATNSTLTLANAGVTNSGIYYAVVTKADLTLITLPGSVAVGNPSLLAWGYNGQGQLGNGTTGNLNPSPITVASNVVTGAAGGSHSLFVTTDRKLWAMGFNNYGQLGNGTTTSPNSNPISVASNVVAVAAGDLHTLFVKNDGTLWAMGYNGYGQLGNGTKINTNLPICIASNVVAVAAGWGYSLFLKNDGLLWAMGLNNHGQLGNGTRTDTNKPVNVASNVVAMTAGYAFSLFVTTDGTLWGMGHNGYGQLGNGTTTDTNLPISVASNVLAAAVGQYHSLFVTADRTLWAMGYNGYGQLGNGTTTDTNLPVSVASNVLAVAAGQYHSLFVMAGGTVWAMGRNNNGQLGIDTSSDTNLPVNLPYQIAANIFPDNTASHSLAIGIGKTITTVTLGNLTQGFSGGAINATAIPTPPGLTVNITYNGSLIAPTNAGSYTVVATIHDPLYQGSVTGTLVILPLKPADQVVIVGGTMTVSVTLIGDPPLTYQWFKDGRWLLGATNSAFTVSNASVTDSGTYYVVVTNASMMIISLPARVVVGNPTLQSWGDNTYGQLGISTSNTNMPVSISSKVVSVAAGAAHSLFLNIDGTLWGVGDNNSGELSIGNQSNVVSVAAGGAHSLFVTSDGKLWGIGNNIHGELGDGTKNTAYSPVNVANNVVTAAAGWTYSLYLKTDGTLWTMGNGTTTPFSVASNVVAVAAGAVNSLFITADGSLWTSPSLPVMGASNVVAAAAGGSHSLFVTGDGTLWAMGANGSGQLGNGTTTDAPTPVSVASNVLAVAAGYIHSFFVKTNGTLWAMGDNSNGELGNGTNGNNYTTPIIVPHLSAANVFASVLNFQSFAIGINYTANGMDLSGGIPSLTFVGVPGASYNVKRSTDLLNWSVIWTTNEPDTGVFQLADPSAPQPKAYYRLQPNP